MRFSLFSSRYDIEAILHSRKYLAAKAIIFYSILACSQKIKVFFYTSVIFIISYKNDRHTTGFKIHYSADGTHIVPMYENQKEYWETYNRPKKSNNDREEYEKLQAQHEKDVYKLSAQPGNISDYEFAKWNASSYHTNKNGNLVLNKELKVGYDVPKTINMNVKVPTQKYKKICSYSR